MLLPLDTFFDPETAIITYAFSVSSCGMRHFPKLFRCECRTRTACSSGMLSGNRLPSENATRV